MSFNNKNGLFIELEVDTPTILKMGEHEVRVYLHVAEKGYKRARFVATKDVQIVSPSRVRKGWLKPGMTHEQE